MVTWKILCAEQHPSLITRLNRQIPGSQLRHAILCDQLFQCLHADAHRHVCVVDDRVRKSEHFPLLVCHRQKYRAAAHPKILRHDKQRRGFHFRCKASHLFPRAPMLLQHVIHRHDLRLVLSVKGVLALHNARMESDCLIPGSLPQCADHIQVCDCRIFDRSIFPCLLYTSPSPRAS